MVKFEASEILLQEIILFFNKIRTQLKRRYLICLVIFVAALIYIILNKYYENGILSVGPFILFWIIAPYLMLAVKIQLQAYGVGILEKKLIRKLSFSDNFNQVSIITLDGQIYEYTFSGGKGPITTKNPQQTVELSFVFPSKFFSRIINGFFLRIEIDKKRFYLIPKIFSLEEQLVQILI